MRWEMRVRASDDREIERSKRKAASDNYGAASGNNIKASIALASSAIPSSISRSSIVASCRSCACASLVSVDLVVHSLPLAPPISSPLWPRKWLVDSRRSRRSRSARVPYRTLARCGWWGCLMPRARMVALTEILHEQRKWPSRRSPPRRGALPRRPSRCSARSARCVCFGVRLKFVVHSVLLSARGWGVDGMISWLIIVEW